MDKALILKKAPLVVALALTLGMLASFGMQGYQLWQQRTQASSAVEQPAAAPEAQRRLAEPRDVANANLFGQPQTTSEATVVQTENLPTTNLRLTLRGVSTTEDEGRTSALIEGPDRETQVYLIGDRLPGDAILRAVHADRVIIDRRGRLENLYFPESSDPSADISSYSAPAAEPDSQSSYSEQSYEEPATQQDDAATIEEPQEMDQGMLEDPVPAQPAYQQDALSEDRRQQIRDRLRQLREQMNNQ